MSRDNQRILLSSEQRRHLLIGALATLALPARAQRPSAPQVEIWKSPTCGCCADWTHYLESNGFRTKVNAIGNDAKRVSLGIAPQFASCHTAVVDGYAIEGHVPAREIMRLLRERPSALGLAVPGMPIGSPGMDGPAYGGRKDAYAVLLLSKDGRSSSVYSTYA